jgi:hypothetical protein
MPSTLLRAGETLTVTANAGSSGTVQRIPNSGSTTAYAQEAVAVGTSLALGPFVTDRNYFIESLVGQLTYTQAVLDQPDYPIVKQSAPVAMTGAATITTAALLVGFITGTQATGATVAYTLPTGAVLEAALPVSFEVGEAFDFTIINLSTALADTVTLTAPASGITLVGAAIVQSVHASSTRLNSATFRMVKTAAATFVCYRFS